MTGHVFIQNLLSTLMVSALVPLSMAPSIDLLPQALSKDLIFRLGFPALCGAIFKKKLLSQTFQKE
jgi:hypothetical protein